MVPYLIWQENTKEIINWIVIIIHYLTKASSLIPTEETLVHEGAANSLSRRCYSFEVQKSQLESHATQTHPQ